MMSRPSSSGNAFIYILLAVALLGGLSFVLSKSNDSNPGSELTDASAKAAAAQILSYSSQAGMAVSQMISNGTAVDDIVFTMPSESTFNTAPTINKLFHPDGGGLQYKSLAPSSSIATGSPKNGYYVGRFNNYEWTPTLAQDVIFSAYSITKLVCEEINLKLTGSRAIPEVAGGYSTRLLLVDTTIYSGPGNMAMNKIGCASCDGKPAYCFKNNGIDQYGFYSILVAR